MSWQGPSAPRVEGMATKSRVVASCASKPASTASRIRCWVSLTVMCLMAFHGTPDQTTVSSRAQVICAAFQNRRRAPTLRKAHRHRFLYRFLHAGAWMTNNRNVLYFIIGVLVVAVGVLGYNLYQAKKEPEGLQI